MNRQGIKNSSSLLSQLLSSDAQQTTLLTYHKTLNDFLQKASFQTCASASFNVPSTQLSVDRTSNSQSQHSGNIKYEDSISDSRATTEPLTHDDLKNRRYWCEARRVEMSLKICHARDKLRKLQKKEEKKQQREKEMQQKRQALCSLEENFDAAWPDPTQYLPPKGREPTQRPDAAYEPNPSRINVFEGYTFIFCDVGRFEDLQGPITNGHGKALLYEMERGRTTADDIVSYMNQVAGNKGLGHCDGSGGVGLVQFRKADQHCDWDAEMEKHVAGITGQKIVETSEFLDAILGNDASSLLRPHPKDIPPGQSERLDEQALVNESDPVRMDVSDTQALSHPSKRSRTRTFVSKFKTFDDGFDIDSIPVYTLEQGDGSEQTSQAMITESLPDQSQTNLAVSEGEDMISELLPGVAAMKVHLAESRKRIKSTPPLETSQKLKTAKLNVMEAV
ncbi:hypothetical protein AJ78_08345 [Emergomyces pasteurianus Ep9510]|uniref:Nibrin second BRCT domain-containing protein n=1 Tax=Emergomyces pasteurianus Ep9510 TaxID=1447872 RepID=A0A1J9Q364_9EURO|nr:hypothetical protein AJ78_08345 [Emergomyces pasteurianus Ep9510]